jgi:uncharacterized membrane protein YfhO
MLTIVVGVFLHGNTYGSITDWISQHTVLPEYFRRHFYETGNIITEFNMNLGAGQNGFNFTYHGMFNPIVLFSYLLPWVDMVDYIIVSSIVIFLISIYLFYYWATSNKIRQDVALGCSFLFAVACPMLYHTHKHPMFIQYMPFVILALIGVDRYIRKKRVGLLIISIASVILINFYFCAGAIAAVSIYAVYRYLDDLYLKGEKVELKGFVRTGLGYAGCILLSVLMSMVLLLPTLFALLGGRDKNPGTKEMGLAELFPDFHLEAIFYDENGTGLTVIFIIAIVVMLLSEKVQRKFLGVSMGVICAFSLCRYILNAGLYDRAKVLIPLLPVMMYMVALFIKDIINERINYKKLNIGMIIAAIIYIIFNYDSLRTALFIADVAVMIGGVWLFRRKKKTYYIFIPAIVIGLVANLICSINENLVSQKYVNSLWDENRKQIVLDTLDKDDTFYRMNDLNDSRYNCNMYYGKGYYQTSVYTSVYNKHFNKLVHDTISLPNPTINKISSINSNSILFQTFMGVKYVVGNDYTLPSGYSKYMEENGYIVGRNDNVYSLGFATSETMSYKVYETLSPEDRQLAMLKYVITENGEDVSYESLFDKLDAKIDFGEEFYKDGRYEIHMTADRECDIDISSYDYDIYRVNIHFEKIEKERVDIKINGIHNALSGEGAAFNNENLYFSYIIPSNAEMDKLNVIYEAGDYVITSYEVYGLYYNDVLDLKSNIDMMTDIQVDEGVITGKINVKEDGYFNITIPYDEAFTLYVDGEEKEIEMTDSAFMGCAISKGEHDIRFEYTVPGLSAGKVISIIACVIFLIIIGNEIKCHVSQKQKKHN